MNEVSFDGCTPRSKEGRFEVINEDSVAPRVLSTKKIKAKNIIFLIQTFTILIIFECCDVFDRPSLYVDRLISFYLF